VPAFLTELLSGACVLVCKCLGECLAWGKCSVCTSCYHYPHKSPLGALFSFSRLHFSRSLEIWEQAGWGCRLQEELAFPNRS
jgi:hypothetical protein